MCFAFERAVMCPLPEVTANSDTSLKFHLILLNLKGAVLSDSPFKAHLAPVSAFNCTLEIFFFLLYCNKVLPKFYQCQRNPCFLGHGSSLCTAIESPTDRHVFLSCYGFYSKKFKAL